MGWIKNTLVDVAVTVLIVLAVTMNLEWARWGVLIYTPLMVILKIVAFVGSQSLGQLKPKGDGVPVWFYHALYGVNVLMTVVDRWWIVAGGWALIWILSFAVEMRMRRPAGAK